MSQHVVFGLAQLLDQDSSFALRVLLSSCGVWNVGRYKNYGGC